MAVWSEVVFKRIVQFQRFDGEFYSPDNERIINTLLNKGNCFTFANYISELTDGKHGGVTYTDDGVVFLRNQNIKNGQINFDDIRYISEEESAESLRAELKPLDIVITTIGTLGQIAIIPDNLKRTTINQNLVRISTKKINPYFLAVYLMTKYGNRQITRLASGNVQPIIVYPNLKKIFIYEPITTIQEEVGLLFRQAISRSNHSKSFYTQAKELLEQELGLDKLKFDKPVGYEASFSEVMKSLRNDPEYYNPNTKKIIEKIKSFKHVKLGAYCDVGNGFPWRSDMFLNNISGEPVVRIRDIKPGNIDIKKLTSIDRKYVSTIKFEKAKKNDIVIGMDGLKYFYASTIENDCYVNQRVAHLKQKSTSAISSEYFSFIINSRFGQAQLLRDMTVATTVGHITNNNIVNLIIPYPSKKFHDKITDLIKESISTKRESQQLLEQAKNRVEQLIEEAAEKNA